MIDDSQDQVDDTTQDDDNDTAAADATPPSSSVTPPDTTSAAATTPPPNPEDVPVGGTVPVTGASPAFALQGPTDPRQTSAYLKQLDGNFANDLVNGHIEPETYADLFAKKSTLGKIGTLFGLMVSGVGSGLGHTSNAVSDMMDKELQNDYDAQRQSKANAQNLLRLNQEHQMQQSQIAYNDAQTKILNDSLMQMQGNRIALEHMGRLAGFTPDPTTGALVPPANPTPQQRAAMQAYGNLSQMVDLKNGNLADKAAGMMALSGATGGGGSGAVSPQNNNGVDLDKVNKLTIQNQLGVKNGFNPDQAQGESKLVTQNRLIMDNWANAFRHLNDMGQTAGQINPADYNTWVTPVVDQMAKQYNLSDAEKQKMQDALFPKLTDWGQSRPDKFKQGIEHFKTLEATPMLDHFQAHLPMPNYTLLKEGRTGTNERGQKVVVRNGRWVLAAGGQ